MMSKMCLGLAAGLVAVSAIGCSGEPGAEGENTSEVYQQPTTAYQQPTTAHQEPGTAAGTNSTTQAAPDPNAPPEPERTGTSQDKQIFQGGGFGFPGMGGGFYGGFPGYGYGGFGVPFGGGYGTGWGRGYSYGW